MSSYILVGSKPSLAQILVESGVPGKGDLLQSAKAQSAVGIAVRGPSSVVRLVSVALEVSSESGSWYSMPLTAVLSARVWAPAGESMKSAVTGPVAGEPSG